MGFEVRRIRPGEGNRLRAIRLRALSEAPGAFASTFEAEALRPSAWWEEASAGRSAGTEAATFVAEGAGSWVGIAGGFTSREQERTVELVSMWVAPAARRAGVGRRLVDEVVAWAREVGAGKVELWVARGNEPAASLYDKAGFVPTGAYQGLPSGPCREQQRMVLLLETPETA